MSCNDLNDWRSLPNAPQAGVFIAHLNELPDGGAQFLEFGTEKNVFRLLLLRSGERVFAYVNRCAHFGVPLAQRIEQLHHKPHLSVSCNVHYARFRWEDGFCEFGDCEGESLTPVPLEVRDGQIFVAGT